MTSWPICACCSRYGYEVCRRLKADEQTCDIPVIFLSALERTQDKIQAFAAGGADYITKPFQTQEVLARVETHLALRKAQKQLQAANRELEERLQELARSEEALQQRTAQLEALLDEVDHRVGKNLMSIIGLLTAEHRYTPTEDSAVVEAMLERLIQRVKGWPRGIACCRTLDGRRCVWMTWPSGLRDSFSTPYRPTNR